jgi:hypothetical protein
MPPKKNIIKTDSSDVVINEKPTRGRKKIDSELNDDNKVEEPKKTRGKKANSELIDGQIEEPKKTKRKSKEPEKTVNIIEESNNNTENTIKNDKKHFEKKEEKVENIDNSEYNELKMEWLTLCDKIKDANKERELLETQKNQILNKLWKLGETSYPKTDIFESSDKIKSMSKKLSTIQTRILLDNDSSDSDSSDSDSSESSNSSNNSEYNKKHKKKFSIKKSESSDSD